MTEEEYDKEINAAGAVLLLYVLRRSSLFRTKELSNDDWIQFLGTIWPAVESARKAAATTARVSFMTLSV